MFLHFLFVHKIVICLDVRKFTSFNGQQSSVSSSFILKILFFKFFCLCQKFFIKNDLICVCVCVFLNWFKFLFALAYFVVAKQIFGLDHQINIVIIHSINKLFSSFKKIPVVCCLIFFWLINHHHQLVSHKNDSCSLELLLPDAIKIISSSSW